MKPNKERQSNFELLRIIAIFLIICFHYSLKGGWAFETGSKSQFVLKIFLTWGELGVNLFMLITGYFMIDNQRRWKQVVLIIAESIFYTLVSAIILWHNGLYAFDSLESFLRIVFPDVFKTYWYVTAYLVIYIFSPYINTMIKSLSVRKFKEFIALGLLFWCIIPSVFQFQFGTSESGFYYNRLVWLIVIYSIGAYIKKHGIPIIDSLKKSVAASVLSFCGMVLIIYITEQNPILFEKIINHKPFFGRPTQS